MMCKFDNQHIVEELKKELGFGWHVYPLNIHTSKSKASDKSKYLIGDIYCVHCKSKKILEVHNDSYSTFSGQSTEWVFKCSSCNRFMTIEYETVVL